MIRTATRRALRALYVFQCGYCGVSETDAGAELTADHFHPVSQGGTDDLTNLVYCCHACNEFKGEFWAPAADERILHPHRDVVSEHITEQDDGILLGLTAAGRFHIQRLQLNRPQLVTRRLTARSEREAEARQASMEARLERAEARLTMLEQRFGTSAGEGAT